MKDSQVRAALFQHGRFTLHSGQVSPLKIECDALGETDWDTLARIVAARLTFSAVLPVPMGGIPFAKALRPHCGGKGPLLIVDDVLTTAGSMEQARELHGDPDAIGAVVFARGPCPSWVTPIFQQVLQI